MTVTYMTGFEAGAVSPDDVTNLTGTAAYDTGTFRTGGRSIRCNPASGVTGYVALNVSAPGWQHFALSVAILPSVNRRLAGNGSGSGLRLNTDGTISLLEGASVQATSSTALTTGTWYWIGWRLGSGTSVVGLQINGIDEATGTITNAGSARIGATGTEASSIDLYIDDVIEDDTGFIAASRVDIALPISDNTVTGVTAGAGGTTNLWDAVNNTPPAGVASANETDTTNIEYPANTTESYIANLETYSTLGIVAADTVLATRGVIRHGEDIATGTKTGTYVGTTNPTQTDNTAITFGNDGGAHGAETGLWVTTFGTLVTSPSITVGTSPTIRVDRASQARVGCIDFMGMHVAWTPAPAAQAMLLQQHRYHLIRR